AVRHGVGQQQRIKHAVTLRQVAGNADPARLFAADQHLFSGKHNVAHVLETDAVLNELAAVSPGDAVEHARGVEGAGDGARPPFVLQQPPQEDGIALVSVHEAAVFGHSADAVGVAVVGKAGVAALAHDGLLQHGHMRQDRLGINSGAQRVDFAADLYHVHAARTQYVPQQVPSRPVHIVNRELETRAGDGIQVGEPGNRLDIGGLQVGFLDRGSPAFRHGASANFRLDLLYHRGTRRAAEFLLELDSVPAPGIVAGSDGDAAGSADMLDRIRN